MSQFSTGQISKLETPNKSTTGHLASKEEVTRNVEIDPLDLSDRSSVSGILTSSRSNRPQGAIRSKNKVRFQKESHRRAFKSNRLRVRHISKNRDEYPEIENKK